MYLIVKTFIDFCVGLISIVLLSPILILIAIVIKITSKGPVFFLQERIGLRGKIFKIIKFRTMIVGAERIGEGLRVSSTQDSRITFIGKFLRTTSLDELPQLFNILKGDMSLIGPRPPVTYHPYKGYDNYPQWAKKRFNVKPGVTGLSQVLVRNSVPWDDRIKIDNEYVKKISFLFDLKIFIQTLPRVIKRSDVYGTDSKKNVD